MREKRLPFTDADASEEQQQDEEPAKRPRTRFVELQPSVQDPADRIDEEVPGSVRAGVEPLVLGDRPFQAYEGGDPALTASHAAADPGFARAQRALLRQHRQEQGALEEALKAQEGYDQPEEAQNEVGDYVEPFHLRKELEEGFFDPSGNYIECEREEEQDAWLDSIEEQVQGTGPDTSRRLPYPNEPVAEPAPLGKAELAPYRSRLFALLQPGETVPAALRRLAGAGPVLDKFGSKEEGQQFFRDRVRSGHAVPPGNQGEFDAITEAAEVLFDHDGQTDIYSKTREELASQQKAAEAAERAPRTTAAPQHAASKAGTAFGGWEGSEAGAGPAGGGAAVGGRGRRHHAPPSAAPAAASEPPVSARLPSVPASERTAATTRGGAGVGAAAHGFAEDVPQDVLGELPASVPPPQEVELGLGLPTAAPTAVELQLHEQANKQGEGEPAVLAPAPTKAARAGSGTATRHQLTQQHVAGTSAHPAGTAAVATSQRPAATAAGGTTPHLALGSAVAEELSAGAAIPQAASAAGWVALMGGMVQPAVGAGGPAGSPRQDTAALLAGRLGSVGRLVAEEQQEKQAFRPAPGSDKAAMAGGGQGQGQAEEQAKGQGVGPVAFDNESANLVGASGLGRRARQEE